MRKYKKYLQIALAGAAAGAVNGLFGAGGGMILVPLLCMTRQFDDDAIFPASVSIILPMCIITLWILSRSAPLPWADALPYLLGSCIGGVIAGSVGKYIPTKWLHRVLGLLILYGGWRYLC